MDEDSFRSNDTYQERYNKLVENLHDPIMEANITDRGFTIHRVNDAFVDVFGYADISGNSVIEQIVPAWKREQAKEIRDRLSAGETVSKQLTLETSDGLKEFLFRGVPLEDEQYDVDVVSVYTDISETIENRRQLRVMNRILRHNLRNKSNIISGHVAQLLAELPEQDQKHTEVGARIERSANSLMDLSEEAHRIRKIISSESVTQSVDCVPHIQRVVQDMQRQYPSAEIQLDLPNVLRVSADQTLWMVFESAIENAIEHNIATEPQVIIECEQVTADGWVEIQINDNGPKIPDEERKILNSNKAITQTQHGTGLGLWLINWAVRSYGGRVTVERSDIGGNSVQIRLLQAPAQD